MDQSTVTFKELVTQVIRTSDPEVADKVSGQIQHWVSVGLLKLVGVEPVETHVGRGGVRKYPTEAIFWCALLRKMAISMSIGHIEMIMNFFGLERKEDVPSHFIDIAMTDEVVYLVVKISEDRDEEISMTLTSLSMVDDWDAGMFFNLHQIFGRVRK